MPQLESPRATTREACTYNKDPAQQPLTRQKKKKDMEVTDWLQRKLVHKEEPYILLDNR